MNEVADSNFLGIIFGLIVLAAIGYGVYRVGLKKGWF